MIDLYALGDEQALLAKLHYNRLIDVFLGITCYRLQSHLRTTVPSIGQVETTRFTSGLIVAAGISLFPFRPKAATTN